MTSTTDLTHAALSKAILDDPDDDVARLALADYLEEQGEPSARSGLIRTQCRLARMEPWDEGYTEADIRQRRLLADQGEEWAADFRPFPDWPQPASPFVRGFPERIVMRTERFLQVREELFRRFAIRDLETPELNQAARPPHLVESDWRAIEEMLQCPELSRLRRLSIRNPPDHTSTGRIASLAACPHLRGLKELVFRIENLRGDRLRELVESSNLAGVESFFPCAVSVYGSPELAQSAGRWNWFPNLRELWLQGKFFDAHQGINHLFLDADWLPRLSKLRLRGFHVAPAELLPRLLREGRLAGLQSLHLEMFQPSTLSGRLLAEIEGPPRLLDFAMRSLIPAYINDSALAGIFAGGWLACLQRLDLTRAQLSDRSLAALAASGIASGLRVLEAAQNQCTDAGLRHLFGSREGWPHLARLNLFGSRVTDEALTELVDHPSLQRLVSMEVGDGRPAPKFLQRLAESEASSRFRELHLNVSMHDSTAEALVQSPWLEGIDFLHVKRGKAGRTWIDRLKQRFGGRITIQQDH
jgi:uncharacterized protein (TIGR02996 family)